MDPFLIKLILSFIVGGAYIAFVVFLYEKFGSKIGGILAGLPSTTLVSLIFIAWTKGTSSAVEATTITPLIIAIDCIYLIILVMFYKYGMVRAISLATLFWVICAVPLAFFNFNNMLLSLIFGSIIILPCILFLKKFPHQDPTKIKAGRGEFLFRAGFAGSVVATAVLLAHVLGPLWGGIMSTFPASFTSTIVLLAQKHGKQFARSASRMMPYGAIGSIVFVVVFYFLVPIYGAVVGVILSYLASLLYAFALYRLILK